MRRGPALLGGCLPAEDDTNEMSPLEQSTTAIDLPGGMFAHEADFWLHLFISLLSLSTHIMSEMA